MDLGVVANSRYIYDCFILFAMYTTPFIKGTKEEKKGEPKNICLVCISLATLKRVEKLEIRIKIQKDGSIKNFNLIYL